MKAFGMVIFNHKRSLTSKPESGLAIALTITDISILIDNLISSMPKSGMEEVTDELFESNVEIDGGLNG